MTARTAPTSVFNIQERPSSLRLDLGESFSSSSSDDRLSMREWEWELLLRIWKGRKWEVFWTLLGIFCYYEFKVMEGMRMAGI